MARYGAVYYNGFFPGFIAVPPNSAFEIHVGATEVMLHVARHVNPVVVTDFENTFVKRGLAGRLMMGLAKPIDHSPTNTIEAEFSAADGVEPGEFFCTKAHNYTLYRRQAFTEITVGAETTDIDRPNSVSPAIFNAAIDEFVQLYRLTTQDAWIVRPDRLQRNVPVIREASATYTPDVSLTAQQRLVEYLPERFTPIIFSVQEYAADLPAMKHDPERVAGLLGHHLAVGTRLSDAKSALLDCFESLLATKNFRFALVECFCIAEVVSFDT